MGALNIKKNLFYIETFNNSGKYHVYFVLIMKAKIGAVFIGI